MSMPTVPEIQDAVKREHGFKPESCEIADVKRRMGLPVKMAHNRINPSAIKNPCPEKRYEPIRSVIDRLMADCN